MANKQQAVTMKKIIIFFLITHTSLAQNIFLPISEQLCSKQQATFNGSIKLHQVLRAWASFTNHSIIIKNIPNQDINLNIINTPWPNLLKNLAKQIGFSITNKQDIYSINKINMKITQYKLKNITTTTVTPLQQHIQKQCHVCILSLDKEQSTVWISAPKNWLPAIKEALDNLDQPLPTINIHTQLIRVNQQWFNNWGQAWALQHNLPSSWLDTLANPANNISKTLFKPWLANQFIRHLLATTKSQRTGSLIAESKLKTTNNQTTTINSGIIMPYENKDSRGRNQTIFKPIVLEIKVHAKIQQKPWIKLKLDIQYDKTSKEDINLIQTMQLHSNMQLRNKQPLVLSSLNTSLINKVKQSNLFSSLPLIGRLLKYQTKTEEKSMLLIIITASY